MKTLLAGLLLAAVCSFSEAAAISNRFPQPGEVGYLPADQSEVVLNPPSLVWLHEREAKTYHVQWAAEPSFAQANLVTNLTLNTYTHNRVLAPGKHFWRYRFQDSKGQLSDWSVVRSFTVTPESIDFPMPSRAEQRERVPKGHPRLFLRPEDLPRLKAATQLPGPAATAYAALRAQADKLLEAPLTPEPTVRGSNRDPLTRSSWWPNRTTTEKACREAEVLAFVYMLTSEPSYGRAARKHILHLASWDPDGPTNFKLNCEAAKPILFRLPRAYDWAYSALNEEDRITVRKVMARRAQDAWVSGEIGEGTGHLNKPYNSHGNRIFHKLGECAIAFLGEVPEAEIWLDYAVNKFFSCYPVWSDDDGGWHEGVSYWNGYMSKIVTWLQVAQTALQIDGFKKPFFAHVGDFPLYVAPPGSPNQGFGDLSFSAPRGAGFMDYFCRLMASRPEGTNAAYWHWRNEALGGGGQESVFEFLYRANLPELPQPKAPTELPVSKVFSGIGVASLHLNLTNANEDVHVLFKSSPFGSQSHGHNPQNSFQVNAYGESLLTSCVYRDFHGSPFHYKWAHSSVAQNTVLVNGEGQIMHSPASQGRITGFHTGPELDYVIGDAVPAYGGRLRRANRTVAVIKPDFVIVYDDLVATNDVRFEFMLHGLSEFELDEARQRLELKRPKANAQIQYVGAEKLRFRQWDGYDPKPEREFPNQWHAGAETIGKRCDLRMITIILPEKASSRKVFEAELIETDTAIGARIRIQNETILVGFRKAESGRAGLAGLNFEAPVAIARAQ